MLLRGVYNRRWFESGKRVLSGFDLHRKLTSSPNGKGSCAPSSTHCSHRPWRYFWATSHEDERMLRVIRKMTISPQMKANTCNPTSFEFSAVFLPNQRVKFCGQPSVTESLSKTGASTEVEPSAEVAHCIENCALFASKSPRQHTCTTARYLLHRACVDARRETAALPVVGVSITGVGIFMGQRR